VHPSIVVDNTKLLYHLHLCYLSGVSGGALPVGRSILLNVSLFSVNFLFSLCSRPRCLYTSTSYRTIGSVQLESPHSLSCCHNAGELNGCSLFTMKRTKLRLTTTNKSERMPANGFRVFFVRFILDVIFKFVKDIFDSCTSAAFQYL